MLIQFFQYEVGKSYLYNYGVHAYGDLEFDRQSHENKPVVNINGSVILTRVPGCEFILTLKKTVISSRLTNNEGHEVTIKLPTQIIIVMLFLILYFGFVNPD